MARSSDPLVVGRVIGDVLDSFTPSIAITVQYPVKTVSNGCEFKPSAVVDPPIVVVGNRNDQHSLFTLVMVDPDAPSPSGPVMKEWIHWLVTDIPGGSDASQGQTVVPYMSPMPPIGIHRYIFVVFKQEHGSLLIAPPTVRQNFCVRFFAANFGLGLPVAAVYYNAQKEPGGRRR